MSVFLLQSSDTLKSLHFRLILKKVLKQSLLFCIDGLGLGVCVLQQSLVLQILVQVLSILCAGGGRRAGAGDQEGGEQEEAELGDPHHAELQCVRVSSVWRLVWRPAPLVRVYIHRPRRRHGPVLRPRPECLRVPAPGR